MAEQRNQGDEARGLKQNLLKNYSYESTYNSLNETKPTSLSSLIVWNVSKAMEKNPNMDIKSAIKAAQAQLAEDHDVRAAVSHSPEQRHFTCAMLAWQQLGHSDTDSLYHFIDRKIKEQEEEQSRDAYSLLSKESNPAIVPMSTSSSQESKISKFSKIMSTSFGSNSLGPVIKLPAQTKVVMRVEGKQCKRCKAKENERAETARATTRNKIEAVCCQKISCVERLATLDKKIGDLRNRAGMLAKREAERVKLLQRAEAAWKDLERGYQRRLTISVEKEEELTKQAQKAVEERNACKEDCRFLTTKLNSSKEKNDKERTAISEIDKQLCELACQKLKLNEECAKADAQLAECHCKSTQLERDLQFKEEQARRKMQTIQDELESSQTMTHETERMMRAELCALKDQVGQVSKQLLEEDAANMEIRKELDELREEKMGMVEDLEGCKEKCDAGMQQQINDLKKKQEQYAKLKERVMECRCKLPVDVVVEVKRTASLAALCHCSPEDKVLKSCSCTSLRSRLMSSLLADLFSGLQSEMSGAGQQMPCQMLKCLEDKHNWDKSSVVKTNLENYFAKLLIGELDIAIATSIEKYHAKWVGSSCADAVSTMKPIPGVAQDEGWQQRAIETRAQNLAQDLAEQLFEQRAEELEERAKKIIASGPPPCQCNPLKAPAKAPASKAHAGHAARKDDMALYPVLTSVKLCTLSPNKSQSPPKRPSATPSASWRLAIQDVMKLKEQIEHLNKESIKKEDLKAMEENIRQIVQQSAIVSENANLVANVIHNEKNEMTMKKELNNNRFTHIIEPNYYINLQKPIVQKITNSKNKKNQKPVVIQNNGNENNVKPFKKHNQNYAVNMCMCSQRRANRSIKQKNNLNNEINEITRKEKPVIIKQSKPIKPTPVQGPCKNKTGICFHKTPSNSSIDKLLETLAKWNIDPSLSNCKTDCINFFTDGDVINFNKNIEPTRSLSENLNKSLVIPSSKENIFIQQPKGTKTAEVPIGESGVLALTDYSQSNKLTKKNERSQSRDKSSVDLKKSSVTSIKSSVEHKRVSEQPLKKTGTPNKHLSERKRNSQIQRTSLGSSSLIKRKSFDDDHNNKINDKGSKTAEIPIKDTNMYKSSQSKNLSESKRNSQSQSISLGSSSLIKRKSFDDGLNNKINDKGSKTAEIPIKDTHIKSSQSKNHTERKRNSLSQSISLGSSSLIKINSSDGNTADIPIKDTNIIPTTESKYMGEINLDRSGEELCRCSISKIMNVPMEAIQCLPCICKRKNYKKTMKDQVSSYENNERSSTTKLAGNRDNKSKNYNQFAEDTNNSNSFNVLKKKQQDSTTKTSRDSYDIQFLGVTLTDLNSQDQENANKYNFAKNEKDLGNNDVEDVDSITSDDKIGNSKDHFAMSSDTKEEAGDQRDKTSFTCDCKFNPEYELLISQVGLTETEQVKDHDESPQTKEEELKIDDKAPQTKEELKIVEKYPQTKEEELKIEEKSPQTLEKELKIDDKAPQTEKGKVKIYDNALQTAEEEEEFNVHSKKCFELAFQSHQINEDSKEKQNQEGCVCCSSKNMDSTLDLETNTFHLLEEHLKAKLQEFKQTSCNETCIPSEEEEKIFTAILSRVKKVITESTKKITCKCIKNEGPSQGSWNRALGLLQEYLKTKIKRVQCSCILAEENNDTILPDVLDKVFNLIEYDFKRLQDVCGCKTLESRNSKVCFKDEVFDKYEAFLKGHTVENFICENPQTLKIKNKNYSLQVPPEMEIKSCNLKDCKNLANNVKDVRQIFKTEMSNLTSGCNCKCNVNNMKTLRQQEPPSEVENKNEMHNSSYTTNYPPECKCTHLECSFKVPDNCNETIKTVFTKPFQEITVNKIRSHEPSFKSPSDQSQSKQMAQNLNKETEPLVKKRSKVDKVADANLLEDTDAKFKDSSCDTALGPCFCLKAVFPDKINEVKPIQEKTRYEQHYNYEINKTHNDNNDFYTHSHSLPEMNGDMYLHKILNNKTLTVDILKERETDTSFNDEDGIMLIEEGKRSYFETVNTKTSISHDNASECADFDYSAQDWCGCSQMIPHVPKNVHNNKRSFCIPDNVKTDVDDETVTSSDFQNKCSCDMVPICHVKMLVENIENRLVSAKCTCDSMIPQVCPVHSSLA